MRSLSHWLRDVYFAVEFFIMRRLKGYSEKDLWNLDVHLSELIYTRLVAFRDSRHLVAYPADFNSIEEWKEVIDKMIFAFEYYAHEDRFATSNHYAMKYDIERAEEGLQLFTDYFTSLWS